MILFIQKRLLTPIPLSAFYVNSTFVKKNNQVIEKIKNSPESVQFKDVISFIESNYDFMPSAFKNGDTQNEAGQNNGSCKIFAFGLINNLSKEETLNCFGDYYRKDVLENPEGTDHQNIRNFIKTSWEGVKFEGEALKAKG